MKINCYDITDSVDRPAINVIAFTHSTEDEENVSGVTLREYQMRFGFAQLKLGGIAGVYTREMHRNQGYSRMLMEHTLAFMKKNGFDVSMLFAVPNYYHKFGYATVIPETYVEFNTKDAQETVPTYQIRKFETEDAPKVVDIYTANNVGRIGTPLRTEIGWKDFTRRGGIHPDPYVVLNETDEVIGYFVCDGDNVKKNMMEENCVLFDIGFQDRTIFETIVHFLVNSANFAKAERIMCAIPADHPFTIFCRRYGCRTNTYTPTNRLGMMRIINQASTLEKITGELEKRLQRSADLSEWSGKILISTDLGQDCLEIDRGNISHSNNQTKGLHLEIPQDKLIQLVMGRRNIEDLVIESDVSVSGEIIPILASLFPLGHPHVWWSDRF